MTENQPAGDDNHDVIASSDGARNSEPSLYMTYDDKAKRCRYWIEINRASKESKSIELSQEEYRDALATMQLELRQDLTAILDNIDLAAFGNWVDRLSASE